MAAAAGQRWGTAAPLFALALGLLAAAAQVCGDQSQGAVFLREFTLIRRESLHDDFLSDLLNNHRTEDPPIKTLLLRKEKKIAFQSLESHSCQKVSCDYI